MIAQYTFLYTYVTYMTCVFIFCERVYSNKVRFTNGYVNNTPVMNESVDNSEY